MGLTLFSSIDHLSLMDLSVTFSAFRALGLDGRVSEKIKMKYILMLAAICMTYVYQCLQQCMPKWELCRIHMRCESEHHQFEQCTLQRTYLDRHQELGSVHSMEHDFFRLKQQSLPSI